MKFKSGAERSYLRGYQVRSPPPLRPPASTAQFRVYVTDGGYIPSETFPPYKESRLINRSGIRVRPFVRRSKIAIHVADSIYGSVKSGRRSPSTAHCWSLSRETAFIPQWPAPTAERPPPARRFTTIPTVSRARARSWIPPTRARNSLLPFCLAAGRAE